MRAAWRQLTKNGMTAGAAPVAPVTILDENHAVNVYADVTGRAFEGFGGAATEAAAHTFYQMTSAQQEELLALYFGGGADYRFLRVSLDSCDFSVAHYEAMSDPVDTALASFSLKHDEKEVIPFLLAAQKKAGREIPLLLSPWSPPAFMKTNGERNHGGKLKPEYAPMWAEYVCRYIEGYAAHGLRVRFVTVQNEPNATQTWDSCLFTGTEERLFVRDHLSPALRRHGLQTEIFIWDHNKERVYDRACETIREDTRELIAGVAFHFYSGDHFDALRCVRERFPEKTLMFSEGCMGVRCERYEQALRYAHEYIGDLREDTTIFFDWNVILDQQGGPNHVKNFCAAPIMCDVNKKEITVNPSYQAIKLLSGAVRPGAVRLAVSAYHPDIEAVAFRTADGDISLALLSRAAKDMPANLHISGQLVKLTLPAMSLTTVALTKE